MIQCACNGNGELTGHHHSNPILDTWTYQVEFPDGQLHEYTATLIAENMFFMCDDHGNQFLLFDAFVKS